MDTTELQFSANRYEGSTRRGRFEGEGSYTYTDGTIFRGSMKNGSFHGRGTLTFPNGVFEGNWVDGVEDGTGRFVFNDGLPFKREGWIYCSSSDRRFWSETNEGIRPAGETQRTDAPARPTVPKGRCQVRPPSFFDCCFRMSPLFLSF
jgi:hypothetical protein